MESATEIWALDFQRAEFLNATAKWVRSRQVELSLASSSLQDFNALIHHFASTQIVWDEALNLAVNNEHPAYDTLLIALAAQQGLKVATYDTKLLSKFPDWTIHVSELHLPER